LGIAGVAYFWMQRKSGNSVELQPVEEVKTSL
jgi:hypothetical protein